MNVLILISGHHVSLDERGEVREALDEAASIVHVQDGSEVL